VLKIKTLIDGEYLKTLSIFFVGRLPPGIPPFWMPNPLSEVKKNSQMPFFSIVCDIKDICHRNVHQLVKGN